MARSTSLAWTARFMLCGLFSGCIYAGEDVARYLDEAARAKQNKDFHGAIAAYKKALAGGAAGAEIHARLGMAYQDAGMLPEAAKELEAALKLDPKLPRVGLLLAFIYLELGRTRESLPHLEQAFASEEQLALRLTVGQRLVHSYFALGDTAAGLAVTHKLQALAPDDPDVLYTASKVYANLWNDAVQRLLEKAPGSFRLRQVLAEVFEAQEKYADAAKEYREIIKLEPNLPGVHYRLGRMILRTESTAQAQDEALAEFQKELQLNPADVPSHVEIGELYLQANRVDDAEKHFRRALEMQSRHVRAMTGLGRVLMARKDFRGALEHLDAASALDENDASIYYHRMIALRSLGRMDEAKAAHERFQALKARAAEAQNSILNKLRGVRIQASGQIE